MIKRFLVFVFLVSIFFQSSYAVKTVIIGGGPGGYAAAFAALSRGHEVTLFEKRDRNTRTQNFYMPLDLINDYFSLTELMTYSNLYPQNFFKENYVFNFSEVMKGLINNEDSVKKIDDEELIFDYEFFKNLYLNFGILELKAFQDYQIRKAQFILKRNHVHSYHLDTFYTNCDPTSSFFMVDKDRFQEYRGSEVTEINLEEKKISYKARNEETHSGNFDFLIIADGASRKSHALLNFIDRPKIVANEKQPRHRAWATATIKIKSLQTDAHRLINQLSSREFERPYKIPPSIEVSKIHIQHHMIPEVPDVEYFDTQRVTHTIFTQDLGYLSLRYPAWNNVVSYVPEQNEANTAKTYTLG